MIVFKEENKLVFFSNWITAKNIIRSYLMYIIGRFHEVRILYYSGLPINDDEEFTYGIENVIEKTSRSFSLMVVKTAEVSLNA